MVGFLLKRPMKQAKIVHKNTFYSLYYNELIIRPSCFQCPYTNEYRVSDLTIGDYQGWNKRHTEYNDNTGISLVLVNSDKGANLFKQVVERDNVFSMLSDANDCLQPALLSPAKTSPLYDGFGMTLEQRVHCMSARSMGI